MAGQRRLELFGTDGVRGTANVHPMTAEMALLLGRAVAHVFHRGGSHRHRIIIGKDTRLSGYMFEDALAAGICSMGVDVLQVGPMPTPGMAFLTADMRCDAGVMISASHNAYQDNGIKFFSRDGFKLPDEIEERIEHLISSGELDRSPVSPDEIGRAKRIDDAAGRYVVFLKKTFPMDLTLDGLRVVLDCANGAAYQVGPTVLEELGAEVFRLGVEPNGRNINDSCGSLYPEKTAAKVHEVRADVGIALDGDADRCVLVDETGSVVDGDAVLALCASHLVSRGALKGGAVVATVMSNLGSAEAPRGARSRSGPDAGRRSPRGGGDALRWLQPRRRAVGPRDLPGSQQHRRRPHHRAADAGDHEAHRAPAVGAGGRLHPLSPGAAERPRWPRSARWRVSRS